MNAAAAAGLDLTPPPGPPARRRSDRGSGRGRSRPPAHDAVMAALLHGLVILGVAFGAAASAPPAEGIGHRSAAGLRRAAREPHATTAPPTSPSARSSARATRTERSRGAPARRAARRRPAGEGDARHAEARRSHASERCVATRRPLADTASAPTRSPSRCPQAAAAAARLAARQRPKPMTELAAARPAARRAVRVTPTRAPRSSRPIWMSWKRRVERVGTVNYPAAAQRQGLTGNPGRRSGDCCADGTLARRDHPAQQRPRRARRGRAANPEARESVRSLSGRTRRATRLLRFAYEWQFEGGREGAASLP